MVYILFCLGVTPNNFNSESGIYNMNFYTFYIKITYIQVIKYKNRGVSCL